MITSQQREFNWELSCCSGSDTNQSGQMKKQEPLKIADGKMNRMLRVECPIQVEWHSISKQHRYFYFQEICLHVVSRQFAFVEQQHHS